jgi:pimeloyl-ACP methyl ester carboxylesterase
MADDVVRLLDSLKIPKAHILGVSMGGMIAQEIAINHPERLKGLVLVCTGPGGSSFSSIPGQEEALRKLTWMFAPPPDMSTQTVLEKMCELCYYRNYFEENKARITAFMPKYPTPLSTFEKHYDAITKFDTQDRLKTIRSNTLVIHGEDDNLVMPEGARTLTKQIPNAKLNMFKQTGHCVMQEKWEKVKPVILDFLRHID